MYPPLFLSSQFISYTFNCVTRHVSVLYASPSGLNHFVSLQFVEYCVICVYIKYHISLKSNFPLQIDLLVFYSLFYLFLNLYIKHLKFKICFTYMYFTIL
jgi:hypothetical protein